MMLGKFLIFKDMKTLVKLFITLLVLLGIFTIIPIVWFVFSEFGVIFGIRTLLILGIIASGLGIIILLLRRIWKAFKRDILE